MLRVIFRSMDRNRDRQVVERERESGRRQVGDDRDNMSIASLKKGKLPWEAAKTHVCRNEVESSLASFFGFFVGPRH